MVLNDLAAKYNVIPGSEELSFEEFVHFDDNTIVATVLTNEEFLAEVKADESLENIVNNDNRNREKKSLAVSCGAYEVLPTT